MQNRYGRELVARIGGYLQHNENRKAWLARVAKTAGISVRQAYAAFYEEWRLSRKTRLKLEAAAQRKDSENDSELILRLHADARYLESVDPEMYREDIEACRRIIARYQALAEKDVPAPLPAGVLPDS